ncbi:hypothetical protein N7466_004617 [Penicillium verhagenii]|uniref:uncharacterized protein n=1 Tax=Penicillium verhagenii TaxID=1562060 RepID=UPI0025455D4D|nr:uncharacterized protein N7466_004617 [Penicillium verhagenii]KAJ5935070.1 hypothetical protein N7466_004617 [Penicillium verhagenii]
MSTQQSQPELKSRSVVSCFIFSVEKATLRVALFQRTPIAGNINAHESPLAAAWREIQEETTLTTQQLEFWRYGKPYSFSDPAVGRKWTIHPLAFRFRDTEGSDLDNSMIKIDWEHEDWGWYRPENVMSDEKFGGIPRLAKSLGRVWFEREMPQGSSQALQSCLEELQINQQRASNELTSIALKGFRDVLVHLDSDPKWWDTTRMAAWHIWKNGHESMAVGTLNALLAALRDIEDVIDRNLDNETRWDRVLAVLDHNLAEHRMLPSRIQESFVDYLQRHYISTANTQSRQKLTILTLSANSTIRDGLLDALASTPISHLDIHILESRPHFEGATMASSLVAESEAKFISSPHRVVKVTVHTDASAALASINVDLVLIGADWISSSGCVSSKTGSLPAVLSAKHISPNSKVLILGESEKVSYMDREAHHECRECDPTEVMSTWLNSGIKGVNILQGSQDLDPEASTCTTRVKNVYFEWVPADLIDGYVCEDGTVDVSVIQQRAREVKKRSNRYFESL